ncbi:MAG: hypothetical protein ACYDBB_26210 [Armatimonadota bacterium]
MTNGCGALMNKYLKIFLGIVLLGCLTIAGIVGHAVCRYYYYKQLFRGEISFDFIACPIVTLEKHDPRGNRLQLVIQCGAEAPTGAKSIIFVLYNGVYLDNFMARVDESNLTNNELKYVGEGATETMFRLQEEIPININRKTHNLGGVH